jgi:hypothetical protein
MSMYYNPQIVKLLMKERLEEALRAGAANRARVQEPEPARLRAVARRAAEGLRRPETAPTPCSC